MSNVHLKAWDIKEKCWRLDGQFKTYGDGDWTYYVEGHCMCSSNCNAEWMDNGTQIIMVLCIELEDENGNTLYWQEGDIFDHPSGKCLIVWQNGGLYMHGSGGVSPIEDAAHWAVIPYKIGNKYEHSELLKGTVYE